MKWRQKAERTGSERLSVWLWQVLGPLRGSAASAKVGSRERCPVSQGCRKEKGGDKISGLSLREVCLSQFPPPTPFSTSPSLFRSLRGLPSRHPGFTSSWTFLKNRISSSRDSIFLSRSSRARVASSASYSPKDARGHPDTRLFLSLAPFGAPF